ncbi:MAG: DUF4956 domain-containing protein [Gemmatimonadaceae bacterium]|nr:DUF4956 domain-containing protein [Gemmatimonadaceae bacterium]
MTGPSRLRALLSGIIARLTLYYAALFGLVWVAWNVMPAPVRDFLARNLGPVMGETRISRDLTAPLPSALPSMESSHEMAMLAILVGVSALALALPMAWVYMHTRQKKGYQQSVVHTIVLLPAVVAAVALLVRNNIGLAFSLAGIVAAVRFRTTLDDSKDAVFIFAVSALGLACGVHLEFAAALSLIFTALALGLWYTDFGRTPPGLEDARAEQHLQRALQIANRTSQFVARIDREILEGMAPAQLEALAQRVKRRKNEVSDGTTERWDATMLITISDDAGRPAVERILQERAKRHEFARAEFLPGGTRLTYQVRARRAIPIADLATFIENDASEHVTSVEVTET